MKPQADSARALGTPPGRVETPAAGGDMNTSYRPLPTPVIRHELWIRVYDVCTEHGAHTDPDLAAFQWGAA